MNFFLFINKGGGLGGTRRGGPEVNLIHSGREDNEQERERYARKMVISYSRTTERDREHDYHDRDRDHEREPRRPRSRDHKRKHHSSKLYGINIFIVNTYLMKLFIKLSSTKYHLQVIKDVSN